MINNSIVFVLPSIKIGGGNRVVIELSNQLILRGFNVDIIYPNNSINCSQFNINSRVNLKPIGGFKKSRIMIAVNLLKTLIYLNNNYKYEKIIFTDPIMSIFIPCVFKKNVFRFIQGDDYTLFDDLMVLKNAINLKLYKFLTKISYNYNVKYLFNSKFTYLNFYKRTKRKDTKFKLVYPAINHNIFFNKNIRKNDEINICIVARKHPFKGFNDFLKAFINLPEKLIDNTYIISHDDLTNFDTGGMKIIKPENDNELALVMNKSHIFISTSWREGFGLPSLEAMSCGCAVILTNCGGVMEYAKPQINCLIYEPKEFKNLNLCIKDLVNNPIKREKLSYAAQDQAKTFSWEKSVEHLIESIYD